MHHRYAQVFLCYFHLFWNYIFLVFHRDFHIAVWLDFFSIFINKTDIISQESCNAVIFVLRLVLQFIFYFFILIFGFLIIRKDGNDLKF